MPAALSKKHHRPSVFHSPVALQRPQARRNRKWHLPSPVYVFQSHCALADPCLHCKRSHSALNGHKFCNSQLPPHWQPAPITAGNRPAAPPEPAGTGRSTRICRLSVPHGDALGADVNVRWCVRFASTKARLVPQALFIRTHSA